MRERGRKQDLRRRGCACFQRGGDFLGLAELGFMERDQAFLDHVAVFTCGAIADRFDDEFGEAGGAGSGP